MLWTVLKTVSQSTHSLLTSYWSSEKMSSFLFQRCVRKKGKINRREGMRKELVGNVAGWDWGLETNGLLKFQKSFPPGLKANTQIPDAQACGSTCKHLPSNAIQKCLIPSSFASCLVFLLQSRAEGALSLPVLYTGPFCLDCPLWVCASFTVPSVTACPKWESSMPSWAFTQGLSL